MKKIFQRESRKEKVRLFKHQRNNKIAFYLFLFLISILFTDLHTIEARGEIEGEIKPDAIFKMNSEITIEQNQISNSIFSINGEVHIFGQVKGCIFVLGKPVYIHGLVDDSVIVIGSDIVLMNGSAVGGDAVAIEGEILQSFGSAVNGRMKEVIWLLPEVFNLSVDTLLEELTRFTGHDHLLLMTHSLIYRHGLKIILLFLLAFLFPGYFERMSVYIRKNSVRSFIIGLFGTVLLIPFSLLFSITLVGFLFIPIIVLFFLTAGFLGKMSLFFLIGHRVLKSVIGEETGLFVWKVFAGFVVFEIINFIPVFRGIIPPIIYLMGIGGMIGFTFSGRVSSA